MNLNHALSDAALLSASECRMPERRLDPPDEPEPAPSKWERLSPGEQLEAARQRLRKMHPAAVADYYLMFQGDEPLANFEGFFSVIRDLAVQGDDAELGKVIRERLISRAAKELADE